MQQSADGQAELEYLPDADIPEQLIEHTSDEALARHLCQNRAVLSFTVDGMITRDVECLLLLASVAPSAQAEAALVVSLFQALQSQSPTPLAVMTMSLVRDTLPARIIVRWSRTTPKCVLQTPLPCACGRPERAVLDP